MNHGAYTHGAGLDGYIERGPGKPVIICIFGRTPQRGNFGMTGRINAGDRLVKALTQQFTIANYHCSHRYFTLLSRLMGQGQRFFHPEYIVLGFHGVSVKLRSLGLIIGQAILDPNPVKPQTVVAFSKFPGP